jgi:dihydrofolate reductase
MTFKVGVIFACDKNGGIGFEGHMPWHAPEDLKQFKIRTMGKPIIMGRKTWESFEGRMLPGRPHIVITSQNISIPLTGLQQMHIARDYAEALYQAMQYGDEAWVIGGASLIEQAMRSASMIRITHMKHEYKTDVRVNKKALERVYANRVSAHEIWSLETEQFTVTEYQMN